jgi:signal transduction histidine kinase
MPGIEKNRSGTLHFSVDSRLLFELGEKLVARKSVALAELVKNSYDADATRVTVRLENVTTPHGKIIVEDNGLGMTLDTIRQTWMRISTDLKDRFPLSERFHRPRTGAKGIGRFASRRIARHMQLHSVAKRKDGLREETSIAFDWPEFRAGRNIGEVPIRYESSIVGKGLPSGITLTLGGLRESWQKHDVEELQRDLFGLVSPFRDNTAKRKNDPGFSLKLESQEFPELSGDLSERFLEASWAVLAGKLDKKGRALYRLNIRGGPILSFKPERFFPNLGPVQMRIYFFVYRSEFFEGFPFSLGDVRRIASNQSGIRIYLDRFRIFPYGDPGDDWLDLDADRGKRLTSVQSGLSKVSEGLSRPMLQLPGNNQLFGAILLSRNRNPDLVLNVSRERVLDNDAFKTLRSFARMGVDWMTVQYARHGKNERGRKQEPAIADPYTQLTVVRQRVEDSQELAQQTKTRIIQAIDLARTSFLSREKEHISELSMIRVLATVGTSVVIFDHELRAVIDALKGIRVDLESYSHELVGDDRAKYESLLDSLSKWISSVEQQGMQIGVLLSRQARERKQRIVLRQVVDEMKEPFSRYMDELGIEFRNDVPSTLRTPPMYGCELQSVLLNLLTNALKAVKRESVRQVGIIADVAGNNLRIRFRDTGIGLSAQMREEVFRPFVSTSEPDPILGVGTGLGLKIARDLLEVYGGTIQFVDCDSPWKACVEIRLPY